MGALPRRFLAGILFQEMIPARRTTLLLSRETSPSASLSISTLASGLHVITVVYGGHANFQGRTSPVLKQILKR